MIKDDYQVFTITLDNARGTGNAMCLGRPGSYVFVLDTSDDDAAADVSFDQISQDALPLFRNRGYRGDFRRLFIQNEAQAGRWLKIVVSAQRGFEVISQLGSGTQSSAGLSVMPVLATGIWFQKLTISSSALPLPYTGTLRGSMLIRNTGAGDVKIAHSIADLSDASNCFLLEVDKDLVLDYCKSAVYAIRDASTDAVLTITETTYPT